MAIYILGKTPCSLCDSVVQEGDDLVSTSHFIHDESHSLWRYSDSVMHRSCFLAWNERERFQALFNANSRRWVFGPGLCHHMQDDGSVISVSASQLGGDGAR